MIVKLKTKSRARSHRVSAPIKWHGGKHYLASKIIAKFPKHTHYVETHFGGGAVLLQKPVQLIDGHSEVVNDIDGELTNFWKALQDDESFTTFSRKVSAIPFSKVEWESAMACQSECPIERAVAFFVRYRQSRQGLGKDFATMSRSRTRRGMNEQASSWWSAVDGLGDAHQRLRSVVIVNDDASKLIKREDSVHTLFYVDPPYVQRTRVVGNAYACEMSEAEHEALLCSLGSASGKFILSGYNDPIYDSAMKQHGWRREDIAIDNKASGQKTKPIKVESLWTNF
ncbi:DNA adenine methylase [Rhodopirellula bahusiensis]|uniref:Adenine methyltransferase n=1 Tax=Rhodopirellula bahusiensis TaxID=2014065 RepID=A0A2G1W6Q7_9BACT|nr:DNA adenine methylase [Rhodopirellula bahusiensis]PHQ34696.1 adenine methyltransferase [Rhodopirellula bahusiensis]